RCDGDLVTLLSAHASAKASRDPATLLGVAGRLEAQGLLLHAAEVYSCAHDLFSKRQLNAKAQWAAMQARRLVETCQGAQTPGLTQLQAEVPLTRREIEIAMLAIRGLSSAEIAEELVISLRTVHSHLQHIYRKAGITRRRDLRLILPN